MADPKLSEPQAEINPAPKADKSVLGDFDPRVVHHRDPKTGRVVRVNPFKMIVERGKRYYEHPVGSGNLWHEDRTHAGRFEQGMIILGADHKVYVAPLSEDQKLARQYAQLAQEKAKLAKELEEIKQEQADKKEAKPKAKAKPKEESES